MRERGVIKENRFDKLFKANKTSNVILIPKAAVSNIDKRLDNAFNSALKKEGKYKKTHQAVLSDVITEIHKAMQQPTKSILDPDSDEEFKMPRIGRSLVSPVILPEVSPQPSPLLSPSKVPKTLKTKRRKGFSIEKDKSMKFDFE